MESLIVYCNCSWSDVISAEVKKQVLGALKDSPAAFWGIDDLCRMSVDSVPVLADWAGVDKLTIIACYPRSVKWLFHRAGLELPDNTVFLNMRHMQADEIIRAIADVPEGAPNIQLEKKGNWIPWFPAVDYDRCVNCKQCLNFCLFGVYDLDDQGNVRVLRPANCKTNCPACARVCPEAAIIFPKYLDSPINGDKVDREALANTDRSKALADLMEGDIHEIIRSRSVKRKRFAAKNDSPSLSDQQKALRLANLRDHLDIPQDVIDSLSGKNTPQENDCPNAPFCENQCPEKNGKSDE